MENDNAGSAGIEGDGAGIENPGGNDTGGDSGAAGNGGSDGENAGETILKRKRGRPFGSGRKLDAPGNPAAGLAPDSGSTATGASNGEPRGRARPRKESGASLQASVDILARKIYGLHAMIAMATKRSDLALTMQEASDLADAVILLGKEYDVKMTGKAAATANLVFTAAVIYGPRIYLASRAQTPAQPEQAVAPIIKSPAGASASAFPDPFGKR